MNKILISFYEFLNHIKPILQSIKQAGGTSYLVGGCVRDLVLERELKDFDIEVHGLMPEQLEAVLKQHGPVMLVGKKFGVFRIAHINADWSLPRKDSRGRKPAVAIDPDMDIAAACRRRDLTMNAMAIDLNDVLARGDVKTFTIIDPYGGLDDIKHRRLRAVDEQLFLEDPLRFFRVMQFIGRFAMQPDDALNKLCSSMELRDTITDTALARERIWEEIKKLMLKSKRPSLGFRWLKQIGRLNELFPELAALIGVKQKPEYHPEGDAFEHTMQTLDAAAVLPYSDCPGMTAENERLLVMLGMLCHDLGKVKTQNEELHAHGHEREGVGLTKSLLKRITNEHGLIDAVTKLVRHHLAPFSFVAEGAGPKAYKRLAVALAPEVTLRQLALVALADNQGRNAAGSLPLTSHQDLYQQFMETAEHATVAHGPEAPVLLGRHLMDTVPPGPALGKLLKLAYQIQIDEGIKDPDELKRRVMATHKLSL